MKKISRVLVSGLMAIVLLPLGAQVTWAGDRDVDTVVGAALGGVIGSIVGAQVGGRDGAVVGAGIGALAGVAISADDGHRHGDYERVRYYDARGRDGYREERGHGYGDHDYHERGWRGDDGRHRFYRD